MIISHSRKFIFVHVPKTGGSSITQMLLPHLDLSQDVILGGDPSFEDGEDMKRRENKELHKHSTALEIKESVGEEIWNQYFVFSFARNPFSRAASLFAWWNETPWQGDKKKKAAIKNMSFEEFLDSDHNTLGEPMVFFLTSKKEKDFYVEYSRNIEVDYLGKLEDIWGASAYISGRLGLPHERITQANKTKKRKHTHEYYNSRSINRLKQVYLEDFKTFGYEKEVGRWQDGE